MLEVESSNFNGTGLHLGDLLEKFEENSLAKVSFLKLLAKENLIGCFY